MALCVVPPVHATPIKYCVNEGHLLMLAKEVARWREAGESYLPQAFAYCQAASFFLPPASAVHPDRRLPEGRRGHG